MENWNWFLRGLKPGTKLKGAEKSLFLYMVAACLTVVKKIF